MTDDRPAESKLTRTKRRWAEERRLIGDAAPPATRERLPPGQHVVNDWPVLDLGRTPDVATERWRLEIGGLVEQPVTLDWAGFTALAETRSRSDIHCVTSWSRYDNDWTGVGTRTLLDLVMPLAAARAVMLHGYDGYTTNVLIEDFAAPDALVARAWQGRPLSREHGGPARLVIPHLYFWKSAKWIARIDLLGADEPGFWESNGYHLRGDPWKAERYA